MNRKNSTIFSILFIAPAFIIYTIFIIIPVISSFYYSLTEWDGASKPVLIGLSNFKELILDSDFWVSYKNTIILIICSLLIQIFFGLLLAYLLFRNTKGMKIFRSIYFLPVVVSPIAVGLMFTLFYNSEVGPLNKLFDLIGLVSLKKEWLSDPNTVLFSVMTPQIWQFIGLYVVIFIAALGAIPEELFESAQIDGANSFTIFTKIVLPLLWDIIQISIVLCVTGSLKSFDYPWIMTQGGPGNSSSYLGVLMFKKAFVESNLGLGSSIAITILLNALIFTVIFNKYFSSKNEQ